ncbi:MAG: DUF2920 family protein [Candidatus Pristimantibacillus sp.]
MSKHHEFVCFTHPNIHNNNSTREFKIYFSEPDNGVNEETGILLLVAGYGATPNSKVYQKMRRQFADEHNLVVLQCDYFGSEFMQSIPDDYQGITDDFLKENLSEGEWKELFGSQNPWEQLMIILNKNGVNMIPSVYKPAENIENFNEMGLMQAMDNITALYYVIKIIEDNQLKFNQNKIMVSGQSHGAYLSLLCNGLIPGLFDLVIDNSAWLFPQFLKSPRRISISKNSVALLIQFDYLASALKMDYEILDLEHVYGQPANASTIFSFHGVSDALVPFEKKEVLMSNIKGCHFHLITDSHVDGQIFKSAAHGLNADFLKFFNYVISQVEFNDKPKNIYSSNRLQTSRAIYNIEFEEGVPLLTIKNN